MSEFNFDVEYTIKCNCCHDLLTQLIAFSSLNGVCKLERKIKQELAFLQRMKEKGTLKKEHIVCSNAQHYKAVTSCILDSSGCSSVMEVFSFTDNDGNRRKIQVDVVSENQAKWTKVIARNSKAISLISKGEGNYMQKSVLDHADDFLKCASQNLILFKPPKVEFRFFCGIDKELADDLTAQGVYVSGSVMDSFNRDVVLPCRIDTQVDNFCVDKLNLDVTALVAYVSAVSNGRAHVPLRGKVLIQQAEWERQRPVKPVLDEYFKNKQLFACKTVISTFNDILTTIGGESEKKRSKELMSRLTVVDDSPCISLQAEGSIKPRSLVIFGTGQKLRAVTVTANSAFVRAAKQKGVNFDVLLHEARALTERKEILENH